MKRMKRNQGRKGRVLRLFARLTVVVLLASVLRLYNFLPIQAIRDMAEMQDVEDPKVVNSFYDNTLPVTRFALHHLVEGKRSMMLCVTGYDLFMGWYDRSYVSVETWDGSGLYAGLYIHQQAEQQVSYLFGKIEDGKIERLSLKGYSAPQSEAEVVIHTFDVPETDIFEKDGERYFISKLDDTGQELPHLLYDAFATGFDREGHAVATVEVPVHSWHT